jgi:hypothetical protein
VGIYRDIVGRPLAGSCLAPQLMDDPLGFCVWVWVQVRFVDFGRYYLMLFVPPPPPPQNLEEKDTEKFVPECR